MLDYQAFRNDEITFVALTADLGRDDLRRLTNAMIDRVLELIAPCDDADVIFTPEDPEAFDPFAAIPEDVDLAWNLGHVVAHITASSEESAAIAAELARGVAYHGRSRYEVPWEELTTIVGCRRRLEESRRMRLASLEMWPEEAHLDNAYEVWKDEPKVNAIGRFVLGLLHADSHLGQIEEIIRQATSVRRQ